MNFESHCADSVPETAGKTSREWEVRGRSRALPAPLARKQTAMASAKGEPSVAGHWKSMNHFVFKLLHGRKRDAELGRKGPWKMWLCLSFDGAVINIHNIAILEKAVVLACGLESKTNFQAVLCMDKTGVRLLLCCRMCFCYGRKHYTAKFSGGSQCGWSIN